MACWGVIRVWRAMWRASQRRNCLRIHWPPRATPQALEGRMERQRVQQRLRVKRSTRAPPRPVSTRGSFARRAPRPPAPTAAAVRRWSDRAARGAQAAASPRILCGVPLPRRRVYWLYCGEFPDPVWSHTAENLAWGSRGRGARGVARSVHRTGYRVLL